MFESMDFVYFLLEEHMGIAVYIAPSNAMSLCPKNQQQQTRAILFYPRSRQCATSVRLPLPEDGPSLHPCSCRAHHSLRTSAQSQANNTGNSHPHDMFPFRPPRITDRSTMVSNGRPPTCVRVPRQPPDRTLSSSRYASLVRLPLLRSRQLLQGFANDADGLPQLLLGDD